MDKEQTVDIINNLYASTDALAIELVEQEARAILVSHPEFNEFVMVNGNCFFLSADLLVNEDGEEFPEFFDMVIGFNDQFRTMGYPMRFTATGPLVLQW